MLAWYFNESQLVARMSGATSGMQQTDRSVPDLAALIRATSTAALFVARHRGQPAHVQEQDTAALQVQNSVLAPLLQLTVDAFARGADEDAELFLRNMHLGSEVGGQRAQPARQPHRQRLQHRFLHPLAYPADPLAQEDDELDRDARLAFEMGEEVLATQHEQFGRLAGGGIGGAILAVEHRDLAEQVAGSLKIERQARAVRGTGFNTDLAASHAVQGIPI